MIHAVMVRALALSSAILYFSMPPPCVAQELAPVIRLSADETIKAKRLAQDANGTKERHDKAVLAWGQFHQTYQAAHPDLPRLRFSEDFRFAFALLKSSTAEVHQVASIELTAEEHKKLEALHQEMIDSEQSQKQAEKNWREFQYQLVVDRVGTSSTEGSVVMLAGKNVVIPNPWYGGLAFTPDFRLAFPLLLSQ